MKKTRKVIGIFIVGIIFSLILVLLALHQVTIVYHPQLLRKPAESEKAEPDISSI